MTIKRWIYATASDCDIAPIVSVHASEEEAKETMQADFKEYTGMISNSLMNSDHWEIIHADGRRRGGCISSVDIDLNHAETEAAHREREHEYLIQDAETAFSEYCGYPDNDPLENNITKELFFQNYQFCIDDALNGSEYDVREALVARFEHDRDMNTPDAETWESVVEHVLNDFRKGN